MNRLIRLAHATALTISLVGCGSGTHVADAGKDTAKDAGVEVAIDTDSPGVGGADASTETDVAVGSGGAAATGGGAGAIAPGGGGQSGQGGTAGSVGGGGGAGAGGKGGVPGTAGGGAGGAATGGAGTGGAGTGGAGTGGAGTGGAGTGGAGTGGAGTGGAGTGGAPPATSAGLYVVAHPDDDLLFMNPALETDIKGTTGVVTVYATSGDGGDPSNDIWRDREVSVRSAHAAMAGVADAWSCAAATYASKPAVKCTLTARPAIRTIFLRILDGDVEALGNGDPAGTVDDSAVFTPAQFTATLTAIMAEVQPGHVGVLDATQAHGSDHQDHINSAQFMLDVARADGVARQLTLYRGYSMYEPSFASAPIPAASPENLTTAQYQEKLRIIQVYQTPPLDDPFDQWCRRFYPIMAMTGPAGPLKDSTGRCLQANGTAENAAVVVATCNAGTSQSWTVGANSRVVGPGGKCLAVGSDGSSVVIKTCVASSADQRWTLLSDGQLHGRFDACLNVSGTTVTSTTCGVDMSQSLYTPPASQRWAL